MDVAPGTVSLLRMENDTVDEAGAYTWTNFIPSPFSAVIFMEGRYSVWPSVGIHDCIHTDLNIVEAIRTIECYARTPLAGSDRYMWWAGTVINCGIHTSWFGQHGIRFFCNGFQSARWDFMAPNTWYHFALITDDGAGNSHLYVDNVLRLSMATTQQPANAIWHIGNFKTHGFSFREGYIDFFRLSNVVQPGPFPTRDPALTALSPFSKKW